MKKICILGAMLVLFATKSFALDTLCTLQEKVVFSCSTNDKLVSICASNDLSTERGYLQYRLGKVGSTELRIPDEVNNHPSKITNGKSIIYPWGEATYLRFIKDSYGYVIYTGIGRGWNKDGITIEKNGKPISNMVCKGSVLSKLSSEFFKNVGIPEDIVEFEIN